MAKTAVPTVCVMSGSDEVRCRSYINHTVYALEHGFVPHLGIGLGPGVFAPYFYKLNAIRDILHAFDWILYLAEDVYVTDISGTQIEEHIAAAEHAGAFLVIAEGPRDTDGSWTPVDTGVMLLRNDTRARRLLDHAMRADLGAIKRSWSEADEGTFTNGDQVAIWRSLRDVDELGSGTLIVSHRDLNSRAHYYQSALSDAFAVRFCNSECKRLEIAKFGQQFGLANELIPLDFYERYSIRKQTNVSKAQITALRVGSLGMAAGSALRRKIDHVSRTGQWN